MRVLVTSGGGVIGTATVTELLRHGYSVRLLSRHAEHDARRWNGVEPWAGDIRDRSSIRGAANGCDAVVHIAGIVVEQPPERLFATINVAGTRNVIEEAAASRCARFVYVSSLGAETARSKYHRSKLEAESIVTRSRLRWTIVRSGNVYGPRDSVLSHILKMMRSMPVLPLAGADQKFQPIWHEDLARALAAIIVRDDLDSEVLEVAGDETTSIHDVVEKLSSLTHRKPLRVPLLHERRAQLLRDTGVLQGDNAMTRLGLTPTSLDDGLRGLVDALPEQLPDKGVGSLEHKRFWASIHGSPYRAVSLMSRFRETFTDVIPLDFESEPHATTEIEVGNALTMTLPMRGNVQVRVEVVDPTKILLVTIEGHPIAGAIEFSTRDLAPGVEFSIDTYTRSANVLDFAAIRTVGAFIQDANWKHVVQRVIDLAGGTSDGVRKSSKKLEETAAKPIERALRATVEKRKRDEWSS